MASEKLTLYRWEPKNAFLQRDSLKGMQEVKTKSSPEWGQLKLLISHLQFLNYEWTNNSKHLEMEKPELVYVGAAPGHHITVLAKMWSSFTFHLYDPQPLDERLLQMKNVIYYPKNFDDVDMERWRLHSLQKKNLYLVFDNRDLRYTKDLPQVEKDQLLIADLRFQEKCVSTIKPFRSLLRIKFPSQFEPDEKKSEDEKHFSFFDGIALKHAYCDKNCQDFSLIVRDVEEVRLWNLEEFSKAFQIHNEFTRQIFYAAENTDTNKRFLCKDLGLKSDFDGMIFYSAVWDYASKFYPFSNSSRRPEYREIISFIRRILAEILPTGKNKLLPKGK